jgi:hypothetical protein
MRRALAVVVLLVSVGCGQPAPDTTAPPAPPAAPVPSEIEGAPPARIETSSMHQSFGGDGLLRAAEPGWHAKTPVTFPQWVQFTFDAPQTISGIELLPQDGLAERGPRQLTVESSADGKAWKAVVTIQNACNAVGDTWRIHDFGTTLKTRYVRFTVLSNCGDPDLLTLRGVKFRP